ncbi:unnamed protein product [Moneuplotes crassus]|uniref:CCZ1/INTU/HPS4 third Longin domain-containing protein n=1 Tax=Euplotes crassus TaxID=5936 RepID=A0AAD1UCD4_EUPCR|nr:unnamed protein product [Moneuplotes crassus]
MLISHDSHVNEDYSGYSESSLTLFNDKDQEDSECVENMSVSNFDPLYSTFKEEDSQIFIDCLKLYYEFFRLFNGSFATLYEKGKEHFKVIMGDFTYNFEKYFYKTDIMESFFNSVVIRGYRICPVDSNTYLSVQKCINNLAIEFPISKAAVFYEEYFLYSDLPQGQVEILHKYLFSSNYTRRQGYEPNWTDSNQKGDKFKIPTCGANCCEDSDEEEIMFLAEDPEMAKAEYEDLLKRSFSAFCKLNPQGFQGSGLDKKGFLIGPTIMDFHDAEGIPRNYEMFSPKVYIRIDPYSNSYKQYRLLVFCAEGFTIAMFITEDKFRLSFEVYEKMGDYIFNKCKSMFEKVDPKVTVKDEQPLDSEEVIKLMYYNESNLAYKQTHRFTKKLLNKELRHYINIIVNKFKENSSMFEYQVTTSHYWVIGKNSLPRIIIVILPLSLSQAEAESEASLIVKTYFAYL